MRILFLLGLILAGLGPARAAGDPASGLQVEAVWSRAALAGGNGVVYMTIRTSGAADALTGASSPVAASAELHETSMDQGVMRMRPVGSAPVTADKPLLLAPAGYHLMLMGLNRRLSGGDQFPLTLTFAHAGRVTVTATVQKAGAAAPATGMGGMKMP